MKYSVHVADGAVASIDAYIHYLAIEQCAPQAAERVLSRIWAAIDNLKMWPRRCPKAIEDQYRDYEIRMIVVASIVMLFRIDDDAQAVTIIACRHGRQRPREDLPE
ncbi:type II toxin-antitoxin system RelE/ParE family toxin [Rhodopirellula sp. MGV]|uniref:type II toxin-antitoxin system RelE/ParE family toxin n=1 Tax=Rhodopirellula sp. MGV TaxID=2023130 RepID=UPI000B97AE3D|nr:type II toxin-antitoxin system RelE/ParE family toxin [Rhodopirellula sp. MGV]OYP28467.1 hypothetical protein CGZ80_27085 [Rhodopirellula sp. MGV]PNY38655.1 type II toxin-antitoxin system RelE/ParE family toxin [Rhodopirellula baltica]